MIPVTEQSDPSGHASTASDLDGLYRMLREWVQADIEWSAPWRANAKKEFAFVAGPGQWEAEDVAALKDQQRPVVTFNKTLKFVRALGGLEANNRREIVYLPADVENPGEVKANELLSETSEWMARQCKAARHHARAFRDAGICGMGWTESTYEFDEDPQGRYVETRCDPLEMGWDKDARDHNLSDTKRRWRIRKMALSEARTLIPGVTDAPGLTDGDLDAAWAAGIGDGKSAGPKSQEQKELREENSRYYDPKREVHIVQVQWWEYEPYIRTIDLRDPMGQRTIDVSGEQFAQLQAHTGPLPHAQLRRKVYKQAFLGGRVLSCGPCPRGDGFTLNCITWEPDDCDGTWFGIVRVLRDPQTWSNKFFAQLMHIINSTAKGGILAEADAFPNAAEALANYAKPNAVTIVSPGAISKGKIMAKPGAALTSGVMQLLEVADAAFGETSGINLELLGLADRDQPGILEAQRKQAAMTILATLFDGHAGFQEDVGRTRLYFMQNYVPDGTMIRISGPDGQQAIPFIKDQASGRYDVIVDEAPTSPHAKEKAWAGLQMLLPTVLEIASPQERAEVISLAIDYVPHLPSKFVEGLKAIAQKALEPNPQAQAQQQIAHEGAVAEVQKTKAEAVLTMAKAASEQAKAEAEQSKLDAVLSAFGLERKYGTRVSNHPEQPVIGPTGGPAPVRELPEIGAPMPEPEIMPPPNGGFRP